MQVFFSEFDGEAYGGIPHRKVSSFIDDAIIDGNSLGGETYEIRACIP